MLMLTISRLTALACGLFLLAMTPAGAADTLKIGLMAEMTGPPGWFPAVPEANGAKLAMDEINKAGGVLGRQIKLVVENAGGNQEGAVSAFGKLASSPDISAFIGPDRSAFIHAIAADVAKTGKPMMIGGT